LRRFWIVVYGATAPDGKGNVVRVLPDNASGLDFLTKIANVIVVGAPLANRIAYEFNDYINPKANIEVVQEKKPEETHHEWVAAGGLRFIGWMKDSTPYPGPIGTGIIGVGNQPLPRLRPLRVIVIAGTDYCDTCILGMAFRQGAGAGIYKTSCTVHLPHTEPCPTTGSYELITDP